VSGEILDKLELLFLEFTSLDKGGVEARAKLGCIGPWLRHARKDNRPQLVVRLLGGPSPHPRVSLSGPHGEVRLPVPFRPGAFLGWRTGSNRSRRKRAALCSSGA
jgi:hypothetical protein